MSNITRRKQDHIDAILKDREVERNQSGFDDIRLIHRALPEIDFEQIDTRTTFLEKSLSFPFLISSMTGGASQNLSHINRNLAIAAEENQVAFAVGSQRAMLLDASAKTSFDLRKYAPTAPIIANIGAVQLNYGYGLDEATQIVDLLEADALFLHLNALQEIIQPEGDRNFSNLLHKIDQLQSKLSIPIILKEVGCGFSNLDLELIANSRINWVDLAGRGGTSWSRIESHRQTSSEGQNLGVLFQDWGLTTVESLEISKTYQDQLNFIASGGIRNGIDIIKSVIMGAQICGIAAPLLEPALESTLKVTNKIQQFKQEYAIAQFLLGIQKTNDLRNNASLLF